MSKKVNFKIIGNTVSPLTIIPGQHSSFNDYMVLNNGKRREARYCETEPKIWKDEQNENSIATNIHIKNGFIEISEDENPTLINFLRTIPLNGKAYEEIDVDAIAKLTVEKEELEYKAKGLIFNASEEELSTVVKVLIPSIQGESTEVIKKHLLSFALDRPEDIIARLGTDSAKQETDIEAQVKEAFNRRILIVNDDNTEVLWSVNNELVVRKAKNTKAVNVCVKFFKAEENVEHKNLLIQRLKNHVG